MLPSSDVFGAAGEGLLARTTIVGAVRVIATVPGQNDAPAAGGSVRFQDDIDSRAPARIQASRSVASRRIARRGGESRRGRGRQPMTVAAAPDVP